MLTKPNQSKASTCFDEVPLISIDYFKYDYQDCTLSLTATFNQAAQDQPQAQPERQQSCHSYSKSCRYGNSSYQS